MDDVNSTPSEEQNKEEPDRSAQPVDQEQPPRLAFPVVGMGASAGGLEAFTSFFQAMPPDGGMAFVLIQHLPPDRESLIAEILSRHTEMPVRQVEDELAIEVNHVYVIRPGHTLTIKDGKFHLGERVAKPGHSRPVDDFFKSLAEEQRERAICVIMSGMGSNGTAGAQAVKAVGGLCIAEDLESALFPSMPQHLIDSGYADHILRPKDMPDVLLAYAGHPYARGRQDDADAIVRKERNHIREVLAILRTRTRQDFSGYKKPTIFRRIQRRMGLNRINNLSEYAKILRQSPTEVTSLADDLLIHVTGFFRDPQAWEVLRERVVVPLVAERAREGSVRCWVTACSSGEEAYSLAMLLVEECERVGKSLDIKVFATDMAERSLQNARNGLYPGGIEGEMSPARLERFFQREDAVYRVRHDLRERVVFAPQNVLQDPPFSRLDIASCRNLLIYLEPEVQRQILELLHFGLREGGALFLGASETTAGADELFKVEDKRARIYRRLGPTRYGTMKFPLPRVLLENVANQRASTETRPGVRLSLAQMTQRALLENHVRAAVTVDQEYRIMYFHGNTEPYLAMPQGDATGNLLMLLREGLRPAVRTALERVSSTNVTATVNSGWIETEGGKRTAVAVTASPIEIRSPQDYLVVSFQQRGEIPSPAAPGDGNGNGNGNESTNTSAADVLGFQNELTRVQSDLQRTIEELQTSNEELKASNEEVMSVNEELQSSNEELETSREEMQSLNEELTTVNAQLQAKIEEHQLMANDLSSLLSSTNIAVLFLDLELRIRRFTPAMKELVELLVTDTGRPLNDLAQKFTDPDLLGDCKQVLEKLVPLNREIVAEGGLWYHRRVLPYRTADNRINGVVVTFIDITERKRSEQAMADQARLLDLGSDAIIVRDAANRIIHWNHGAAEMYGWTAQEAMGKDVTALLRSEGEKPIGELISALVKQGRLSGEVTQSARDGRRMTALCRWILDVNETGSPQALITASSDITEKKRAEEALRESEANFRAVADLVPDVLWRNDPGGAFTWVNRRWTEYTGQTLKDADGNGWSQALHPQERAASLAEFQTAIRSGQAMRQELRLRGVDGTYRWFLVQAAPLLDSQGRVVQWFGTATDIHEQRSMMEALRESEEQFRLVVEGVRDFAMFMIDESNRIISWNPAAERLLGWTEKEILGQTVELIFTPEDRAAGAPDKERLEAARSGRAIDERWHINKEGRKFWGSGILSGLPVKPGQGRRFVKVLRDETPRKRAEEALQQAITTAENASRVKDEFLATLGHELRTPLSAILLWTKMLRRKATGDPVTEEALQGIESSAAAQRTLIEDLLDTSRITAGMLRLQPREVDFCEFVGEAVETILPTAQAKGVKLIADLSPEVGMVRADPDRLRQVIWNLLTNAVKFTPEGGRVDILVKRLDSQVEIQVADTGHGIEADFLAHVFDRFRQGDSSTARTHSGLGLGLAITKQLVELHGGTIKAASPGPGKGSVFTVQLPLPRRRRSRLVSDKAGKDAQGAGESKMLSGIAILLVEDDNETRGALSSLLKESGAAVTAVGSAAEALKAYKNSPPDLILSDIGLPGEDGYELIRRIRKLESKARDGVVPAIALTAFARETDQQAAMDAGFQYHIGKPVDVDQLFKIIEPLARRN